MGTIAHDHCTCQRTHSWASPRIRRARRRGIDRCDWSGDLASVADDVIELRGRPLLPGFQDSHAHPSTSGARTRSCHLLETDHNEQAYLEVIAEYAARSATPWITGAGWSMEAFDRGIPTAAALDAIVSDRPVMLWNSDHHGAWVNTKALEIAGFTAATPDPPDGRFDRDEHGNPIGSLQEGAVDLMLPFMPEPTAEERVAGIVAGQAYLLVPRYHGVAGRHGRTGHARRLRDPRRPRRAHRRRHRRSLVGAISGSRAGGRVRCPPRRHTTRPLPGNVGQDHARWCGRELHRLDARTVSRHVGESHQQSRD